MAKELPYFRFEPAEWKFGRIQRQTDKVKVAFIDLICTYWHHECKMTRKDAELDFGKEEIGILIDSEIIKEKEGYIKLKFLDNQMEELEKKRKIASDKGLKSAQQRSATVEQQLNSGSTTVEQQSTDKIRVDKSREDKIRVEDSTITKPPIGGKVGKEKFLFIEPTIEEVTIYCKDKGYNNVSPAAWLSHYRANGFMVGKNKMKNWAASVDGWAASELRAVKTNPFEDKNLGLDFFQH